MAETGDNASNGSGKGSDASNTGKGDGTEASKAKPGEQSEVDLSKLSGDELKKVLENQELYKLPRIAELMADSKELAELKKKQDADTEKALADQKKFQELAEKRAADLETAKSQIKDLQIRMALQAKLAPAGVVDLDAAVKLADLSEVKIDDSTGAVTGIDEVVEALKKDKTYLFNPSGSGGNVGSATNETATESGGKTFKRSQLRDPKFYQENRDDILKAQAEGRIIDDLGPGAPAPAQ